MHLINILMIMSGYRWEFMADIFWLWAMWKCEILRSIWMSKNGRIAGRERNWYCTHRVRQRTRAIITICCALTLVYHSWSGIHMQMLYDPRTGHAIFMPLCAGHFYFIFCFLFMEIIILSWRIPSGLYSGFFQHNLGLISSFCCVRFLPVRTSAYFYQFIYGRLNWPDYPLRTLDSLIGVGFKNSSQVEAY